MLPDDLLQSYMQTFYGYGSYDGPYWFVGMEEGGGSSAEAVARRLAAWDNLGRPELVDLMAFHAELGATQYLGEKPKLQATWGKLIRVLLAAQGMPDSLDAAKGFQRTSWGRRGGNNCVVELLPLPSPSTGKWLYGDHSALPHLGTRETYKEHYAAERAEHLGQRVLEHKPVAVVFYSLNGWYMQWWRAIAGVPLEGGRLAGAQCYIGSSDCTIFVVTPHPVAYGVSNEFYRQVGAVIAAKRGAPPYSG